MKRILIISIILFISTNIFSQERGFKFSKGNGALFYSIELIPDTFLCVRLHKPPIYELGIKHLSEYIGPGYPREFVNGEFIMPKINGVFQASFTINDEGQAENIEISESPHPLMSKKFKENCKKLKKLTHATYEGKILQTKIIYVANYKSR